MNTHETSRTVFSVALFRVHSCDFVDRLLVKTFLKKGSWVLVTQRTQRLRRDSKLGLNQFRSPLLLRLSGLCFVSYVGETR